MAPSYYRALKSTVRENIRTKHLTNIFYFRAKEELQSHAFFKNSPLGLAFGASAVSGVVVALTICPFDVTTVRLYNQGLYTTFLSLFTGSRKVCLLGGILKSRQWLCLSWRASYAVWSLSVLKRQWTLWILGFITRVTLSPFCGCLLVIGCSLVHDYGEAFVKWYTYLLLIVSYM